MHHWKCTNTGGYLNEAAILGPALGHEPGKQSLAPEFKP